MTTVRLARTSITLPFQWDDPTLEAGSALAGRLLERRLPRRKQGLPGDELWELDAVTSVAGQVKQLGAGTK